MKLLEYQTAALVTAQERAFDHEYLVPMIVGEIGELFGQKAKSHWHGWEGSKLEKELVSEFGDVCWGTAILLHVNGVTEVPTWNSNRSYDPWQRLLSRAHWMHLYYIDTTFEVKANWMIDEAKALWRVLENDCEAITGVPFATVLQANLDKLASRAARGTLVGQGDHR